MKTPVGLLCNECRSQPTCSNVSQVQVNNSFICGSMFSASYNDIPKSL